MLSLGLLSHVLLLHIISFHCFDPSHLAFMYNGNRRRWHHFNCVALLWFLVGSLIGNQHLAPTSVNSQTTTITMPLKKNEVGNTSSTLYLDD